MLLLDTVMKSQSLSNSTNQLIRAQQITRKTRTESNTCNKELLEIGEKVRTKRYGNQTDTKENNERIRENYKNSEKS